MSGISTGVGLISGIDTATLISQLMAIESRPKVMAMTRLTELQAEQGAFLGLNSLLLSLKTAAADFSKSKIFQSKKATSSNTKILTASATTRAQPGTYQMMVHRLVTTSQKLSKGHADTDRTGLGGTEISFELGQGRLSTDTQLAMLNQGEGVDRGLLRITDSAGNTADIDLSTAVTVGDVLDAINSNTTIRVTASVDGDGLKLTDDAGGAPTALKVENVGDDTTATDLGILGSGVDDGSGVGVIQGSQVNLLFGAMSLSDLNDGNGVRISRGVGNVDFRINTASGQTIDVVLGQRIVDGETQPAVATLQGVIDRINEAAGGSVTASIGDDGVSLRLVDHTTGGNTFEVTAGTAGYEHAARDLGIFGTGTGGEINGTRLIAGLNSVLMRSLNGGTGLNGATTLDLTDRSGNNAVLSLDENSSLSDVVAQINSAGLGLTATLNDAGNGLLITDSTGGSGNLIVTGDAAAALGIDTGATGVAASTVEGNNVQLQYVSGATRLDDLNYGRGIASGSFKITDATGVSATIEVDSDTVTLQDLIAEINSKPIEVTARVNDTGDGLILESTAASPSSAIKVETVRGTTAADLGILGSADTDDPTIDNFIDGSYEKRIALETTDTLDDLVRKVNDAGIPVVATIVNDGAGATPFRVNFTSEVSGTAGDLIVDTEGFDLDLRTMTEAQDAVVFFGSSDPADAVLITSTTNTLDDVIAGVNIDLLGTSTESVQLTVSNDSEKMVGAVQKMVDAFNSVISRIDELDSYNAETEQRGVLLGDPTVARIRSQLYRTVQGEAEGITTQFTRLSQVGVSVGADGKLEFDADRLREALVKDPQAVEKLFAAKVETTPTDREIGDGITVPNTEKSYSELGIAEQLVVLLEGLTDSVDGTLANVGQGYDRQIELQQKRIEAFDRQLADKRSRLEQEFAALEVNLAMLQQQQQALASLSFITPR